MPGLDGTGISFEPLRRFLPHNIAATVIRYPSDRLLSFADTVDCAFEQIAGEQDIIVAESFSGPVAIALLGSGRVKAKGVLLCATFARLPKRFAFLNMNALPLEFGFRAPFQNLLLRYFIGNAKKRQSLESMQERIAEIVPVKTIVHRIRLLSSLDVRPWLPHLKMPCWYIRPTRDRLLPAKVATDFVQAIPHLVIKEIPTSHFVLQSEPAVSAAVIEEFMKIIPCG